MSNIAEKKVEKRINDLTLEQSLLKIRVKDLEANLNHNAPNNRQYKENSELIKSSRKRLTEIAEELKNQTKIYNELISIDREKMSTPLKRTLETHGQDVAGNNNTVVPTTATLPSLVEGATSLVSTSLTEDGANQSLIDTGAKPKSLDNLQKFIDNTQVTLSNKKPRTSTYDPNFEYVLPSREMLEDRTQRARKEDGLKKVSSYSDNNFSPYPNIFDRTLPQIRTNPYVFPKLHLPSIQETRNPSNEISQNRENENKESTIPNAPPQQQQQNMTQPQFVAQNIQQNTVERARETFLRRLRSIPKFNGDSYKDLREFIDIMETLQSFCINYTEENELYEHMFLQLRGEAKSVVLNLQVNDWGSIKDVLLEHFSYLSNQSILISKIENLQQNKNETLTEYADRARKLLRERDATYCYLSEEQKREHNRTARRAFAKGIENTRLKNRLMTRGASSLEDAIAYAIEAENEEQTIIPSNELYCRSCRSSGHRERNCNFKRESNDTVNKLISALRTFSISNSRRPISTVNARGYGRNNNNDRFNNNNYSGQNTSFRRPFGNEGVNRQWNNNNNNNGNNRDYNWNNGNRNGFRGTNNNQNKNDQIKKPRPNQNNFNSFIPNSMIDQCQALHSSTSEGSEN